MNSYQKHNHFPGCWNLGRKDLLWMRLQKFRRKNASEFNFMPRTFLLNNEFERFKSIL